MSRISKLGVLRTPSSIFNQRALWATPVNALLWTNAKFHWPSFALCFLLLGLDFLINPSSSSTFIAWVKVWVQNKKDLTKRRIPWWSPIQVLTPPYFLLLVSCPCMCMCACRYGLLDGVLIFLSKLVIRRCVIIEVKPGRAGLALGWVTAKVVRSVFVHQGAWQFQQGTRRDAFLASSAGIWVWREP